MSPASRSPLCSLVFGSFTALLLLGPGCSSVPPAGAPDGSMGTLDGSGGEDLGADSRDGTDTVGADTVADTGGDATTVTIPARPGCNPIAVTDECLLPWPSDLLTRADSATPTGRRLDLPEDVLAVPAGQTPIEVAPFNRADGAPTTSPILVHLGVAVAEEQLVPSSRTADSLASGSAIALFDLESGERVPFLAEMDHNQVDGFPDRYALIIRPLRPLAWGTRHVVALRRSLRAADGSPLPPSVGFEALRDGRLTDNAALEAARPGFMGVFAFLAEQGYAREDLYLAWDYTTASREHVLGPILSMREAVFAAAEKAAELAFTIDQVDENPSAEVRRIVYGTFTPPSFLTADNSLVFDAEGRAVRQKTAPSYPFTMVVPLRAETESLPLVVFGHGVFGTGRDYLAGPEIGPFIQGLAQQLGGVVVATDWIGLSSGDQQLLITEVVPDINRVSVVTDRLLQSLVNNLTLIELSRQVLAADVRVAPSAAQPLLTDATYYYGVSLGGIQGSSLISVSRHISRAVVAVPGGSWANILPRSIVYSPIKALIDGRYPDPLVQQQFLTLLQIRFDHTDGANLARLFLREPLEDAPAGRVVIVQESIGDCQVPNLSTEILSRAFGVGQLTPSYQGVFGLEQLEAPTDRSVLVQYALLDHLATYTPPVDNTIPELDNDAHSDMNFLPNVSEQIGDLFTTGQVVQHCTGNCDPN